MQTRSTPSLFRRKPFLRMIISGLAAALSVTLSACSAPRLSGRAESEHLQQSPCEQAYGSATLNDTRAKAGHLVVMRYLSAAQAQRQWLLVAANCSQRFAEGSIHSAQNALIHQSLANQLDQALDKADTESSSLEQGDVAHITGSILAAMALAEDRAGFAVETMASRHIPNASISTSDDYKAAASRLMSASSGANDPRQKVYAVGTILAHPAAVVDAPTGLRAPTLAAVEIDCAREEITAINGTDTHTNAATSSSSTGYNGSRERERGLLTLATLVSGHALTAFDEGYPSFDHALFS